MARGRTPTTVGNLILDGYEEIARRVLRKYRFKGFAVMVIVDDAGRAFAKLANGAGTDPPVSHFVGTYSTHETPEILENDLLERLRELTRDILEKDRAA